MSRLNTLDRDTMARQMGRLDERIRYLERLLQGQPIGTARIGNLSADKLTSGTLTIKDGTDGAKLVVVDSMDNEIVTLDTNGIIVEGGNIVLKNSNGDTVFDASGIVSLLNFESGSASSGSTQTITSTSYTDITGASLNTSNFARSKKVVTIAYVGYKLSPVNSYLDAYSAVEIRLIAGGSGSSHFGEFQYTFASQEKDGMTFTSATLVDNSTFSSGVSNIKLDAKLNSPTNGQVDITGYDLFYLVLGN